MSRAALFAAGGWILAAIGLALGYLTGDDPDKRGYVIVLAIAAVAAALVAWLAPRFLERPDRPALVLAILSAVGLVVFWLGLTPILAAGAAYLALEPRAEPASAAPAARVGLRNASLALASLATILFVVACIFG